MLTALVTPVALSMITRSGGSWGAKPERVDFLEQVQEQPEEVPMGHARLVRGRLEELALPVQVLGVGLEQLAKV